MQKMTPIQTHQAVATVNEPKARRTAVVQNYAALAGINSRKKYYYYYYLIKNNKNIIIYFIIYVYKR